MSAISPQSLNYTHAPIIYQTAIAYNNRSTFLIMADPRF